MRPLFVALAVVSAVAVTPALGASSGPRLVLAETAPLVVKGSQFKPGERVKIIVSETASLSRTVRAGAAGRFVVTFEISLGRCDPLFVRAVGLRGSRAAIDLTHVACAPPP